MKIKNWYYLIPVVGFILVFIKNPKKTDAVFVLAWFFIHFVFSIFIPIQYLVFLYQLFYN